MIQTVAPTSLAWQSISTANYAPGLRCLSLHHEPRSTSRFGVLPEKKHCWLAQFVCVIRPPFYTPARPITSQDSTPPASVLSTQLRLAH